MVKKMAKQELEELSLKITTQGVEDGIKEFKEIEGIPLMTLPCLEDRDIKLYPDEGVEDAWDR